MMAKGFIWFAGLFFIVYGLAFTFFPLDMTHLITQGNLGTPSNIIDVRSTYGGMTIAVGIVILLLGRQENTVALSLLTIAIILIAMAITRLLGIAIDGSANSFMYAYLALEIVGAMLALYLRKSS